MNQIKWVYRNGMLGELINSPPPPSHVRIKEVSGAREKAKDAAITEKGDVIKAEKVYRKRLKEKGTHTHT